MKLFASILSVLFFTTAPTVLLAKGDTVKITIEGTALPSPIEITDPAVRQFNLWSGPGTFMNGVEGRQGFIIDWTNRLDEAPVGLHHYRVSFYEGCVESSACHSAEPSLAYVVFYDYDPSMQEGFVYLPGGHDEFARLNMWHIYRGKAYEGHWFRATKAWDDFVKPMISRATEHTALRCDGGTEEPVLSVCG